VSVPVAQETDMPARLFIVAQRHPELYEYLSSRFADETDVTVVLDRRLASRRRRALPAAAERRRTERRSRPDVEAQLRTTSLAVVTAPSAAQPAGEVRQWVDTMQRGVAAIRGVLDDRDRLQHEALAILQENEWLRAEMDRSWKELAAVDVSIARAIAIVNDLRARLRAARDPDATA
jgi:hypothetical protein